MNNLSTFYSSKKDDKQSASRLLRKLRYAMLAWLIALLLFLAWYWISPNTF